MPRFTPIDAYVGEAALRTPSASALVASSTSYATLEAAVVRSAEVLRQLGVQPGERVAIWLPKGEAFVVAILATLRAGAVYVPLGIEQPFERVRAIVQDCGAKVLVSDCTLRQSLQAGADPVQVMGSCHFGLGEASLSASPSTADSGATPTTLAAILYTSGSTGVPKGVRISHGNLSCFVLWAVQETGVGRHDVFANHASFNFDLSTFDLFAALRVGAGLWIVPDEAQRSPATLAEGISRYAVSVWYSVPSVLSLLLDSGALDQRVAATLRVVACAGEVLPIRTLRALKGMLRADIRLYNWYGPTETNVCTSYRVREADFDREAPLPIGRPLPGVSVRIEQVRFDGDQATGELIVSGACVTPGYWGRQVDRNTGFHARGEHATGDIVGYEGQELVYRGRRDRMVKLNGFRVELGEVEAVLALHPGIREVSVALLEVTQRPRLCAFYSAVDGAPAATVLELKAFCGRRLPRYMIPAAFERLPSLPRNQNGKVDAAALSAPARAGNRSLGSTNAES